MDSLRALWFGLLACLCSTFFISCQGNSQTSVHLRVLPEVGEKTVFDSTATNSYRFVVTSSASLDRSWIVEVNGIQYTVATDEHGVVTYVSTADSSFATPEGFTRSNSLREVLDESGGVLVYEPGFDHYVVLPSGWAVAFGVLTTESGGPTDGSNVCYFFRRKDLLKP